MAKLTALFFTVLFLCYMLSHATRPEPVFHKEFSEKAQHTDTDVEAAHAEAVDENCEGASEEECLMRRTLAAHLDYIYTQKHKP